MSRSRSDDRDAFVRMAREYPLRTTIYTFGLPLFGLVQLVNGYVHGGALQYIGLFCVVAVAWSVLLTRYHVATYRRESLTRHWVLDG